MYLTHFLLILSEMYHLFALLLMLAGASGDGNFSFIDTHVVKSEIFSQASFNISRTGGQDTVLVTCQVGNNAVE